jgi:hypothetical protein
LVLVIEVDRELVGAELDEVHIDLESPDRMVDRIVPPS